MNHDELVAAAQRAYVFTYPLAMHYRTLYRQALTAPGALGQWLHLEAATPDDIDIVTPCADVRYSYAWVDVAAEPWVLTVPPVEDDRYVTSQWDDLWGHVLDNVGSVNDGTDGTTVLLAAPDWTGEVPQGIDRVVRGESRILGTLTRVEQRGDHDRARAADIQQQLRLRPLSDYLGDDVVAVPSEAREMPPEWPAWTDGDETTPAFWEHVRHLLTLVTPHPDDASAFADLALLGLVDGAPAGSDDIDVALETAIPQALAFLAERGAAQTSSAGLFGDRKEMGTRYLERALGVMLGILGNVTSEVVYASLLHDADGELLDGRNHYTLTFAPGQQPPTRYFWSLTSYSLPDRYLVRNPIDRYTFGSATPSLRANADGSLTVQLGADDPGSGAEGNWLPLAAGPSWVVLRCYGPEGGLVDGSYVPPTVERVRVAV